MSLAPNMYSSCSLLLSCAHTSASICTMNRSVMLLVMAMVVMSAIIIFTIIIIMARMTGVTRLGIRHALNE